MRFAKAGVPGYSLEVATRPREEEVDDEFLYLMVWYADIRNQEHRGQHFEPVSLQAISVYEDKFLAKAGIAMELFDWDMLLRLDHIWRDCVPDPGEQKGAKTQKRSTRH